ncbi:unnamed protein product, partial [Polarella glacialis]
AKGICPKLEELFLGGNPFGELGAKILMGGLGALRKDLKVHIDSESDAGASAAKATPKAESEERARREAVSVGEAPDAEPEASLVLPQEVSRVDFELLEGQLRMKVKMPETVAGPGDFDLDLSAERLVVHAGEGVTVADEG